MSKTNADIVAQELDNIFAVFGLAGVIVSDNGPPFSSSYFRKYCELRNIEHIFSPPYHPASNGLAERAVQTTKAVLGKLIESDSYSQLLIDNEVNKFLHHHRQTPTTEDNIKPNESIFAFSSRTELSSITAEKQLFSEASGSQAKTKDFKNNEKVINTH